MHVKSVQAENYKIKVYLVSFVKILTFVLRKKMSDLSLLMFSLKILQSGYWKFKVYVHYFGKILIYALDIIYPY